MLKFSTLLAVLILASYLCKSRNILNQGSVIINYKHIVHIVTTVLFAAYNKTQNAFITLATPLWQ